MICSLCISNRVCLRCTIIIFFPLRLVIYCTVCFQLLITSPLMIKIIFALCHLVVIITNMDHMSLSRVKSRNTGICWVFYYILITLQWIMIATIFPVQFYHFINSRRGKIVIVFRCGFPGISSFIKRPLSIAGPEKRSIFCWQHR